LTSWHNDTAVEVFTLPGGHNVQNAASLQQDLLGWESSIC
jgi:hypothetical protein